MRVFGLPICTWYRCLLCVTPKYPALPGWSLWDLYHTWFPGQVAVRTAALFAAHAGVENDAAAVALALRACFLFFLSDVAVDLPAFSHSSVAMRPTVLACLLTICLSTMQGVVSEILQPTHLFL